MKGFNENTVKLGGVYYEPRVPPAEAHDFPYETEAQKKGLDSLVDMGAVTKPGKKTMTADERAEVEAAKKAEGGGKP